MQSVTDLSDLLSPPPRSGLPSRQLQGSEDFFRLISAQLGAQNPLEPIDETQFLGQIAQFSQLDQITATNQHLQAIAVLQESLAAIQQMTEGVRLIGETIEWEEPGSGETRSGIVDQIRVEEGIVVLDVEGEPVPLTWLRSISKTPAE